MTGAIHTLAFAAVAAAGLALGESAARAETPVTLTVTGVTDAKGFLMIGLHDEAGWSGAPLARLRLAATGATMTAVVNVPAPGRYGIKLFHDVDGDGEMARNIVGFPKEPIGFSNDAPLRLGPPGFAEAAFDVGPAGAAQTITLR